MVITSILPHTMGRWWHHTKPNKLNKGSFDACKASSERLVLNVEQGFIYVADVCESYLINHNQQHWWPNKPNSETGMFFICSITRRQAVFVRGTTNTKRVWEILLSHKSAAFCVRLEVCKPRHTHTHTCISFGLWGLLSTALPLCSSEHCVLINDIVGQSRHFYCVNLILLWTCNTGY